MKNLYFCVAFLLGLLMCGCSSNDCDALTGQRKAQFDYGWQFRLDTDSVWRDVDLPHDWSIEGSFDKDNAMGDAGGYLPDGIGHYKKVFKLGKEYDDKLVSLYFEGSYGDTKVKVNGNDVGDHHYGYSSFAFDITPYINIGEDNIVEVIVDNSNQQNSRWYSGSGLYRHVWLMATDPLHLKHWGNQIVTNVENPDSATVDIRVTVENETDKARTVTVKAVVSGGYELERNLNIAANSDSIVNLPIEIKNPRLWDVDNPAGEKPALYTAEISIIEDGKVIDSMTETFGLRSIDYSADEGFMLNGRPMKVFGGCLHHDNGILGAAAYDRAEVRKVQMMKDAGFNALRTSHNPVSEALLNACDSIGMLVIDEAFDGWYDAKTPHDYHKYIDSDWQDDIAALVLRDRNHPSVICWSIGNEILERDTPEAVERAKKFGGLCRQLDGTRPVTQALACWNDKWVGQDSLAAQHEIVGYNYLLGLAPEDHKRVPDRIIWQTESFPRDVYRNWTLMNDNPYIIGDFVWTSIDYLGESGIGRWYYDGETPGEHYQGTHFPWHGAYCGDIDLTGWRKPVSYYRQAVFAPETAEPIHIAVKEPDGFYGKINGTSWSVWPTWDSWNWDGWEGRPIEVEVYSLVPEPKLYLNDVEITDVVRNNHVLSTFTVPYAPGTLKAVADAVGEVTLSTAGDPVALRLTPDRSLLDRNAQDLSFVTVEVIDADGNVCPNAEVPFSAAVAGDAKILTIGNANLQDCDPYHDQSHSTWKGRALIVVKSPGRKDVTSLTVTPNDTNALQPASCEITTK